MTRLASLIVLSALVVACAQGHTAPPTQDEYDDVAHQLGSTVTTSDGGGEVGAMLDVVALAHGIMPPGFSIAASGEVTGTHLGEQYSYVMSCADAGAIGPAACTALTDDAAATVGWTGTLTAPNLTVAIDRSSEWQLGAVQSGVATIDGSGTFSLTGTATSRFRPVTASSEIIGTTRYDGVMIDRVIGSAIGGQITYDLTAIDTTLDINIEHSATDDLAISAVLTFATTGAATLVLDGTQIYDLPAPTGTVVVARAAT